MIATLFVATGLASFAGVFILNPILNPSNYLAIVLPNKNMVVWDPFFGWSTTSGVVFIGVFVFPILRKLDEDLATGYLASRIMSGVFLTSGTVATLLLIPLSQQFLNAGSPQGSWFLSYADILKQATFLGQTQLDILMLGIGGSIFTRMLVRYRLVHRYIALIGLIGYFRVFIGSIAVGSSLSTLLLEGMRRFSRFPSQRSRSSLCPPGCS
ncbi:MAG TPA: DUF4386 domain-containing protein [Candidatus Dormibacteraeota bacterium]|jgi:hypothetical protein|nr:DUF4386 domain-containing protein [Candidatus Dormibacteraeota bacterium]